MRPFFLVCFLAGSLFSFVVKGQQIPPELAPNYDKRASISPSVFFIHPNKSVSPTLSLQVEVPVHRNFSIAGISAFHKLRQYYSNGLLTQWVDDDQNFFFVLAGAGLVTDFTSLLEMITNKAIQKKGFNTYAFTWLGYNLVTGTDTGVYGELKASHQRVRGGASLGIRHSFTSKLGLFLESGYSSLGYLRFGVHWKPAKLKKPALRKEELE